MLFHNSDANIRFDTDFGGMTHAPIACDDAMIRQAITNLLRNAVDAMVEADTRIKNCSSPSKWMLMRWNCR